jgi:hypothetical protein
MVAAGLHRSSTTTRVSGGGNTGRDNGQPMRSWRRDRGCGKRWQSGVTASYGRGTEKDGVQWPKELTTMVKLTRRAEGIHLLSSRLKLGRFSKASIDPGFTPFSTSRIWRV